MKNASAPLLSLTVSLLVALLPTMDARAEEPRPPICSSSSDKTCPVSYYTSTVKAINECGFKSVCAQLGLFAEFPSLECSYSRGIVKCDAWPKTSKFANDKITYVWSVTGSLSIDPGLGYYSSSPDFPCADSRGGTVIVKMRAPGGSTWVQLSAGVPCKPLIEP